MITARTRLVALFGHPVTHSLSPAFQNAGFAAAGLDLAYLACDVEPARLGAAVAGLAALSFVGANVTRPHKQAILAHCHEVRGDAAASGAANTLVVERGRVIADNTDVAGFELGLAESGLSAQGARTVVIGAGGAARAVCVALLRAGADQVSLLARRVGRARTLAESVAHAARADRAPLPLPLDGDAAAQALAAAELLVDATPGVEPTVLDRLAPGAAVVALAYGPDVPLVAAARAAGRRAADGLPMLLHQGARAFELWTERPAPIEAMRRALADSLAGPMDQAIARTDVT